MICKVQIHWDAEARVYYATSNDIPGLSTEHENADTLMENIVAMIPDLLALNGKPPIDRVRFELERVSSLADAA